MRFSLAAVATASLSPLLVAAFQIPAPVPNRVAHSLHFGGSLKAASSAAAPESDDKKKETDEVSEDEESAALKWAAQQKEELAEEASSSADSSTSNSDKKKYVIVGAGWGGWGAAKALCESGIDADITIIDALPDPTGATPYLSKTGKPVEAGTRGFWKDYPNICELLAELGIEVRFLFIVGGSILVEYGSRFKREISPPFCINHCRKTTSFHPSQIRPSTPPMVWRPRLPSFRR